LLGHSSLRSTEIYTHLTEPLRDQLRLLLGQTTEGLFEGRGPSHGLIPALARPRRPSNWRTSSAGLVLGTGLDTITR
jgi:hypothetical protein